MCKPAIFSCFWPFKMQKESKREDKRRKVTGKQLNKRSKKSGNIPRDRSNPKNKQSYERLSDEERRTILDLRHEGFSMHDIAGELGRSSKTIHGFLKRQGSAKAAQKQNPDRSMHGGDQGFNLGDALLEQVGPILAEESQEFLRKNRDVLEQLLYRCLELDPPKRTMDDLIQQFIADSPEHRRRLAELHITKMERNGQSELDILERGLTMFLNLVGVVNQGDWKRVAETAIGSGELRKVVVQGLALLKNQNSVPMINDQDAGATNHPPSIPTPVQAPHDSPEELSPAENPPSDQTKEGSKQRGRGGGRLAPEVLAAIREPIPFGLKNSPEISRQNSAESSSSPESDPKSE